jgi:hypothetical protein
MQSSPLLYVKEASGHKSDRYIGRYVKPNQEAWSRRSMR